MTPLVIALLPMTNQVNSVDLTTRGLGAREIPLTGRGASGTTLTALPEGVVRVDTTVAAGAAPWSASLKWRIPERIGGETLLLSFRARSKAKLTTSAYVEMAEAPNTKYASGTFSLTPEWREYTVASRMKETLAAGAGTVTFFLGYGTGDVEVKDVRLRSLGDADPKPYIVKVPMYGTAKASNGWKRAADARIERIRKEDLTVEVTRAGKVVRGAKVQVEQVRHAFPFGTAAVAELIVDPSETGRKYRESLTKNFNAVVLENNLKWNSLDADFYGPVDEALARLAGKGMPVRGHNLVWGSEPFLPKGLWALSDEAARERVRRRASEAPARWKGRLYVWDVVNEAVTERGLWDRLGWPLLAETFKLARAADPSAKLAYNDYDWTEPAAAGVGKLARFKEIVKEARANGAPIDILGAQTHLSIPITPPETVMGIWESTSKELGGLPIEITEYDAGLADDADYARHTSDLLRAAFSSPSVSGFYAWGFWEGAHWRAKEYGHFVNLDWTDRPVMTAWRDLTTKTWWTRASGVTGATGTFRTRAFQGVQEVTVTVDGVTRKARVTVQKGRPARVVVGL